MLIDANKSVLLVVDMQERLLPAVHDHQRVLENCVWLVRAAQKLDVPVAASEQYPQGLGHTAEALRALLPETAIAAKMHFSCADAGCLSTLPGADRTQAILVGVEAHVCVLQTAIGLREQGRDVYVVADCVGSRAPGDRDLALARMHEAGVSIVSREMVLFEWLKQAGTPLFREISRDFLR
jgi:nicotinamidase-related amidase